MYMSREEHRRETIELVTALLRSVPPHYTGQYGRWVWVTGKLAGMIIRWSRMDMTIRQEVRGIVRASKRGENTAYDDKE
jgi:hypothetical protein